MEWSWMSGQTNNTIPSHGHEDEGEDSSGVEDSYYSKAIREKDVGTLSLFVSATA
jgi:hypothetical protein